MSLSYLQGNNSAIQSYINVSQNGSCKIILELKNMNKEKFREKDNVCRNTLMYNPHVKDVFDIRRLNIKMFGSAGVVMRIIILQNHFKKTILIL